MMMINYITYLCVTLMKMSKKYVSIFLINTCEIKKICFTIFLCVVKKQNSNNIKKCKIEKNPNSNLGNLY